MALVRPLYYELSDEFKLSISMVQMFLTVFNSNWYTIFFFFLIRAFLKKTTL